MPLGNNLKRVRFEFNDMSQSALASAVGVSRQTILLIEKGRIVPSVLLALRIGAYFREPVDTIFYIIDEDDIPHAPDSGYFGRLPE